MSKSVLRELASIILCLLIQEYSISLHLFEFLFFMAMFSSFQCTGLVFNDSLCYYKCFLNLLFHDSLCYCLNFPFFIASRQTYMDFHILILSSC